MQRKLEGIQGLRFIAASSVIVDHAADQLVHKKLLPVYAEQVGWHIGLMGVWTFFIISGLIMFRAEHDNFGSVRSGARFILKRIIRIAPMYWIVTTLTILMKIMFTSKSIPLNIVITSYLFIPTNVDYGGVMRPILNQGWTLNYEMFFYVLFAVCMVFRLLMGIILIVLSFTILTIIGSLIKSFADYSDPITTITFLTDPIILLFVFGVIIAYIYIQPKSIDNIVPQLEFKNALASTTIIILIAVSLFYALGLKYPMNAYSRIIFWPLAIYMVLICGRASYCKDKLSAFIVLLGDASYSTYLSHELTLRVTGVFIGESIKIIACILYITATVVMANAAGLLIYILVERPLTTRLRRAFL